VAPLPTVTATRHLVDNLGALDRPPRDPKLAKHYTTLLDAIRQRLISAVERDAAGSNRRDGYPARTLGDGTPRGSAGLTSVEAAADSRLKPQRDRHHELTARATTALAAADVNLNIVVAALASLDDLTDDSGPEASTCDACHPIRDGYTLATRRNTSVGGRLERPAHLCEACYEFVRQTALEDSNAGYLPSPEQVTHHDERGRWRIKAA